MSEHNCKIAKTDGGDTLTLHDGGTIQAGDITLTRTGDDLVATGLPTSDPGVEGALWNNSGLLSVSTGT